MTEYKLFCFNNAYLNGIHNGIQAGHASDELMRHYYHSPCAAQLFRTIVDEWADNHKTYVVLNGGDHEEMLGVLEIVRGSGFPYDTFYEPGMNNLLTSICVVLPDNIYESSKRWFDDSDGLNSPKFKYQQALANLIQKLPAAR